MIALRAITVQRREQHETVSQPGTSSPVLLSLALLTSLPGWQLLCSDRLSYPTLLKLCDHRHVLELRWSVVERLY